MRSSANNDEEEACKKKFVQGNASKYVEFLASKHAFNVSLKVSKNLGQIDLFENKSTFDRPKGLYRKECTELQLLKRNEIV